MTPAVNFYTQMIKSTTAGVKTIDGFISNTANYTPTKEPYMTASESVGGGQVYSGNFYQYNPYIDEADYDSALYSAFVNAGLPSSIGFLIDTSRNGWGSSNRPTGPSSSGDLNTFVNASKIDLRNARGQWCNQTSSGLGAPPTANPAGYFSQLQAFVWIKPPGESDGTYAGSSAYVGGNADENCDPAHINALANNTLTGSLANAPSAGEFFPAAFDMLVQNASPAVPVSTGLTVSAAKSSVAVHRGHYVADYITVNAVGGLPGPVSLSVSGLPAGVTAAFSAAPTSTRVVFTASKNAFPSTSTVTITGTSGAESATVSIPLKVER
jgi:cellulase/cellobiase CelA1